MTGLQRHSQSIGKLLIVGRVMHYRYEGSLYAYAPYAREIDLWADLFSKVTIASSLVEGVPPGDCAAFEHANIEVASVSDEGGHGFTAKARKACALPRMITQLSQYMRTADAVHVRCPSDLGLLGAILAPIFSCHLVAKYAGQWSDYRGEPWTSRLQKALLRSRWWRGPVTVYGEWPGESRNIVPFFTSGLTEAHIARARRVASRPRNSETLRLLYVGRLSRDKNVNVLLEAMAKTVSMGARRLECVVIGEGPERAALQAQADRLGLRGQVRFTGGLSLEKVIAEYEGAEALVLVSNSEGWPKAITEAMAFGVVCIGSDRGLIPQILGEGRGILVPPGDEAALSAALYMVASRPAEVAAMASRAAEWAQKYSLERLQDALSGLLTERWGVPIPAREKVTSPVASQESRSEPA